MRKQLDKPQKKNQTKLTFTNKGKKEKKNKNNISEIMKLLNLEMDEKVQSSNEENNNIYYVKINHRKN